MVRSLSLLAVIVAAGLVVAFAGGTPPAERPQYDADGQLLKPESFETWVFVGSSLGLTYADNPPSHEMFHNVYIEPTAYKHYVDTGQFPDGTMLAMTLYGVEEKTDFGSGRFSSEFHGLEMAVKDESRFDEGWAYYNFGGMGDVSRAAAKANAFPKGSCYSCHAEHAQDDNVFVQYYPVLRRVKEASN